MDTKMIIGIILILIGLASAGGYLPLGLASTMNLVVGVILIIIGLVLVWKRKK